ncbi:uncharacterized protein LOC132727280 [Ruditapes philippinarum]|uniref:uncharacterized protein LOC132727280 n=1 Tax=Ruditapes philippinarum TaxID=129788 RepID=UPI00295B7AAB|nr:uncharacterized protein LOC132727280 [Ruditapes philippinarum]
MVRLTPGQYMVKCDAGGSNPEPVMNLFLNDQNPYVSVKTMADTTSEFASYTGTFTVDSLTINAHNAPQALVCKANIPGASYPSVEAGIALMVQIDKPTIKCDNFTASLDDRQSKVGCNVSAGENSRALKCDKLSWYLSVKGQKIMAEQRWKDQTKEYDIIESSCKDLDDKGLHIQLMLYTVKEKLFKETFFLVYGEGQNAHRQPITLYDVTVSAAGIATPLSLLTGLLMAFVSTHLARL